MIARLWKCEIVAERGEEYEAFAHERSLPMFEAHPGFRGVAFLGDGAERTVLTLWDSAADAEALESSPLYRETVEAILAAGFILSATDAILAPVLP